MTAFERAEEIVVWLGRIHVHTGPDDPCAIRDKIMAAIHEERADLSRMLELAQEREKLANAQIERLLASLERLTDRNFWLEKEAQSIHGFRVKEAEERKVVDLQIREHQEFAQAVLVWGLGREGCKDLCSTAQRLSGLPDKRVEEACPSCHFLPDDCGCGDRRS